MGDKGERGQSALRIVAACKTTDEFVQAYSHFCEGRSLFIATKSPKPMGQEVRFKLGLATGEHLMSAIGEVVEVFTDGNNRFKRPGMRVEVEKLDDVGRQWMRKLRTASGWSGSETTPPPIAMPTPSMKVSVAEVKDASFPKSSELSRQTMTFSAADLLAARNLPPKAKTTTPVPVPAPPPIPAAAKPPAEPAAVPKPVRDDLSSGWELDSPASMPLRRPKGRSKPPPPNESSQKDRKRSKRSTRDSAPSSKLSVTGSAPMKVPPTDAAEAKPEAAEAKPETVESKPAVAEAKPEAVESKPEAAESKPESAESKPEVVESKPEAAEAKPDDVDGKPEVVAHPRAQTEPLAASSESESGADEVAAPSGDAAPLPPPPRQRRPTMPAILQKTRSLALPAPLVPKPAGAKPRFPTQPFKALDREPGAPLAPLGSPEDSHPTAVDTESPLMHPPPIPADARAPTADELHPQLSEDEGTAADTNLKLPGDPPPRIRITRQRMPLPPEGRRDDIDEVTVTEEDEPPEPPTQVVDPDRAYVPVVAVAAPPVAASPPTASRRNLIAAVLVTAVIAGGLGYLLGSAGDEPSEPPAQAVVVPPECPEPAPAVVTPPPPEPTTAVTPPEVDAGAEDSTRPTPSAPRPCFVSAVSTPAGANVFIDSSLAGRSPLRKQVSCGKHKVRFELATYGTVDRSVSIRRGSTAKVTAQMSRPPTSLRVESSPSGATVRVNGATVGVTPLSTSVTSGVPATVSLSKAGYKSVTQKVTPNPGGGRVGVTLKRDAR